MASTTENLNSHPSTALPSSLDDDEDDFETHGSPFGSDELLLHQAGSQTSYIWHKYRKTIIAAVSLTFFGFAFAIAGFVSLAYPGGATRGLAFVVIGVLCAVPGGYQMFVIYQAWKRKPGYSLAQVPSFDD